MIYLVEAREVIVPGIALIASFLLVITVGGVDLSGSQAKSIYCDLPVLSESNACNEVTEDSRFTAEFDIHFNRIAFQEMDLTTTVEQKDFLSALRSDFSVLAFPAETREAQVSATLRDSNGRIVAGDTEFYGTIEAGERKTFDFDVGNLESGNYELFIQLTGEDCGLLACTDLQDTKTVDVEIPVQPLGESKNFNLVALEDQ